MTSHDRHARLWRSLRVVSAATAVVIVGAGVAEARTTRASGATATANPLKQIKTIPVATLPTSGAGISTVTGFGGVAVVYGNGENLASKTQTVIKLPQLSVFAYPVVRNEPDPNFPGSGRQVAEAWIISNPTTVEQDHAHVLPPYISYGTVPTVHIATLGFGAIPITADVTLAQTVDPTTNQVQPLIVYAQGTYFTYTVSGQLSVHLSNVVVDGIPLKISPACTTIGPAKLTAFATNAQYQISSGGLFSGNTTIPAFTGCSASIAGRTENLDTLLTGTLSGKSNPTYLTQNGLGSYDPAKANDCYTSPPPNHPEPYQFGCLPETPIYPPLPTITASLPVPTVATSLYDPPAYGY